MIIRTQDRHKLINFNQISYLSVGQGCYGNHWHIFIRYPYPVIPRQAETESIAKYSTEAKAVGVLDMICERLRSEECNSADIVFDMPKNDGVKID